MKTTVSPELQRRYLKLTDEKSEEDEIKNSLTFSFSSENPVQRNGFQEVLSHDMNAVDLTRLKNDAPFLFNHDVDKPIGRVRNAWIENGKGKVKRFFEGFIFHVPYENGIALKRAHSTIIMDQYKMIKFYNNNERLLFYLENDIEERNNLAELKVDKLNFLEFTLDNYLKNVRAPKWRPGITWKKGNLKSINSFH